MPKKRGRPPEGRIRHTVHLLPKTSRSLKKQAKGTTAGKVVDEWNECWVENKLKP